MDALKKLRCSRGGHKSHFGKLLENIDALAERQPRDKLELEDRARLEDYLEQLKHKATVFRDIDKNILDNLEDEHEFEATIVESGEMQSTLSQRIAIITHKLTVIPQQMVEDHREENYATDYTQFIIFNGSISIDRL